MNQFTHIDKRGCLDDLESALQTAGEPNVAEMLGAIPDATTELLETGSVTVDTKVGTFVFTLGAWEVDATTNVQTRSPDDPKMVAALKAVDKILANLRSSDLVSEFGSRVLDEISKFRIDMAADIVGEF